MKRPLPSPDEHELHAYLDGELDGDPLRKAQVETLLKSSPELADQLEHDRSLRDALNAEGLAVEREPVPPRLLALLEGGPAGLAGTQVWMRAAAAVAIVAASAAAGWSAGQWSATPAPPAEVASWQEDVLFPASSDRFAAHTALPALDNAALAALDARTDGLIDLDEDGLQLTHISTHVSEQRYVRELHYRNPSGGRVSVLASVPGETAQSLPRVATHAGQPLLYWTEGETAIGVTGDLRTEELSQIAMQVRALLANPHNPVEDLTPSSAPVVTAQETAPAWLELRESPPADPGGILGTGTLQNQTDTAANEPLGSDVAPAPMELEPDGSEASPVDTGPL